ncbi:MAG: hypothetical protein EPO35_13210 [Acidobacteria bacterium]|nr:MAG: hypothetical protein EPO35_13210 [Acidobacteriota bacterium]
MQTRVMKTIRLLSLILVAVAAPLAAAQTASQGPTRVIPDYTIGPADELAVTVSSPVPQPIYSAKNYRVQNDGTILLPGLDAPIKVAGLTVQQAREAIRKALIDARQFENPIVDITVTDYRASSVNVQGAVRNPGKIPLRADRMTLSDAIAGAGGLQTNAGSRIYVTGPNRPKPEPEARIEDGREVFSKQDLVDGKLPDARVYDDDMVFVEVAPHFYVTGYVKNSQSEYNWEPGMTLQRAIAMAGGATSEGALNRVEINRKDPKTGGYKKVKLNKDNMATPIEPEDVIKVPKKRM